jgi:hypothetical protein
LRIMSHSEAEDLLQHAQTMTTSRKHVTATDEELKEHHANQEILYPENVNWTMRKADVLMFLTHERDQLKAALCGNDADAIDRAKAKVAEYEQQLADIEARQGPSQVSHGGRMDVFQSVARKNIEINMTNERLAKSRRALETTSGGVDPFARFDTTGMSYFSITKTKLGTEKAVEGVSHLGQNPTSNGSSGRGAADAANLQRPLENQPVRGGPDDWKLALLTRQAGYSSRRAISNAPLLPVYGSIFEGLDDFRRSPAELKELYPAGPVLPPSVDALYADQVLTNPDSSLAVVGKAITLEEYNRMRAE